MSRPGMALVVALCGALIGSAAVAQEDKPAAPDARATAAAALDALLRDVRNSATRENRANKAREARFLAAKAEQERLLAEAKAELVRVETRSDELKANYDANEKTLSELETVLNERQGALGEMFGIVRQVAGDTKGFVDSSLVSAQIPGREKFLGDLAQRKELPTIAELRTLWAEVLQEMIESGRITRFKAPVVTPDGRQQEREVTRIGVFNAVSGGRFLTYDIETRKLHELVRQPPRRFTALAADLEAASPGQLLPMAIDPSRGALMSLYVDAPTLLERITQGKEVGYVIIALGIAGLLVAIWKWFSLMGLGGGIRRQLKSDEPHPGNPLGRVMMAYQEDHRLDVETLGLKLDEAILKETPQMEKGLTAIKIIAAVAPLLGLLGTVIGMIVTFQAITLFGTGDPKLMAGGISQALVTTVLGLGVAIPLILFHGMLAGRSGALTQILDEQSAGMVAEHAERGGVRTAH